MSKDSIDAVKRVYTKSRKKVILLDTTTAYYMIPID